MLVLTRSAQQSLVIGQDVVVTVTRISGQRVRLAIDAPASVRVDRLEVRRRAERAADAGLTGPEPSEDDSRPFLRSIDRFMPRRKTPA